MEEKLVSVNITTYNRAELLLRCLESVVKQSYQNLEIIVVDDCSTDNTELLVREFCKNESRIVYIKHNENCGNAATRNTAWLNSKGNYIAFMDDDDEWLDVNKIIKQVKYLEDNSIDMVSTDICSVVRYGDYKDFKIELPKKEDFIRKLLTSNGIIFSPTVLVKRSILEKTNGFDSNIKKGVDSDFYRDAIIRHQCKFGKLDEITTLVHRDHEVRMGTEYSIEKLLLWNDTIDYILLKYTKEISSEPSCMAYWYYLKSINNIKMSKIEKSIINKIIGVKFMIKAMSLDFNFLKILKFHKILLFN